MALTASTCSQSMAPMPPLARLRAALLVLIAISPHLVLSDTSIWTFSILESTLPPSERPPFSQAARLDLSALKYQIIGIVGGYVAFVLLLAIYIALVGRRLRREALSPSSTLDAEELRPSKYVAASSPTSTTNMLQKWTSFGRKDTPSLKSDESPVQASVYSFDDKVIEKDKVQRQDEMERLYAAVIAQDAKAPRPLGASPNPSFEVSQPKSPTHVRKFSNSSRNFSHPQPSPGVFENMPTPFAPTPQVPALPTPHAYFGNPQHGHESYANAPYSPLSPVIASPIIATPRPQMATVPQSLPSGPRSGPTPVPEHSHNRNPSASSHRSKSGRGNIRNLQISSPIPKSSFQEAQDLYFEMDTRSPLSPHFVPVNPGRPPLPPDTSRPGTPIEDDSGDEDSEQEQDTPTVDRDFRSSEDDRDKDSIIHAYGGDDFDDPITPPGQPKKPIPTVSVTSPPKSSPKASSNDLPLRQFQQPRPIPQPFSHPAPMASAATKPLPFRAFHPPQPTSPGRPLQPFQSLSPGPMKQTFLSPRRDRFPLPGGMNPVGPPNSAALLSAGLASPYSPYMPFSPMTPVTPHLTNRRERRARERERPRMAATEEDRVKDDKELWGDAW